MSVSINGTNGLTFNDASTQNTAATGFGFKNRILNGSMVLDQRNAGASVTVTTANQYTVDRWQAFATQSSKYTAQQNANSVTPPSGFTNYLGLTSSSAYSVVSGDYFFIRQGIEGFNVADLGWGAAGAATVTLSFRVYSSLTGTFGGALGNAAGDRSYPFTYTVSSANTWTTITVTVAGDTAGTWLKTNGGGLYVYFGIGVGSTYSGTAGAWAGAQYLSATGATSVVGTNGATFYITGVQLEKGSTATSFDYRPYGTELALCQRYYEVVATATEYLGCGFWNSATAPYVMATYKVTKRAAPTMSYVGTVGNMTAFWSGSGLAFSSMTLTSGQGNTFYLYGVTSSGGTTGQAVGVSLGSGNQIVASAEL